MPRFWSAIVKTIFFVSAAVCFAQQDTGIITGLVTDQSGSAVPNATVALLNTGTNTSITVTTDNDGLFVATPLRIGSYTITVEAPGFKKSVRQNVLLRVQDRVRIDFGLEVGQLTETIEVTIVAPLLASETTSLGQVIATKPVSELPLNGRNFIQLIALTPGAYIPQKNNSLYQDFLIGINGNRIQNNNFLLDGINNNTTDNNQAPVLPSPDAIAEFKVQSNLQPAEFGRGLGGTINISLRSGTNEFHGVLFEFLRNDKLDANNFFNVGRARPAFQQNQFGGAAGGPVYLPKLYDGRNRTFFFADYQGTRIRKGLTRIFTVPTAEMRVGDFSGLVQPIFDADTTRVGSDGRAIRDQFPDNRIPSNRFDPIMQRYLALYPQPNRPGIANNYILNPKYTDDNDQGDIKLDHLASEKDSFMFRYSHGNRTFIVPLNVPDVPYNGYFSANEFLPQVINNRGAVMSYTRTFSPRVVNEARFGFNRLYATVTPRSEGQNLATEFGIRGVPSDPQSNGLTVVGITGFSSLGDSFDTRRGQNVFHLLDNLTIIAGRHSFKMGFEHRRTQFNLGQGSSPRGAFTYNGVFSQNPLSRTGTGSPFADFLLGLPDSSSIGTNVRAGIRVRNYSGFIQDDWKVSNRLTMNIGVRYEYTTPVTEVVDRMANFDMATNKVVLAAPESLETRALARADRNNFAPRIGVAFQLDQRTVIRTGYGIFHTLEDAGHHNPTFNPPFSASFTYPSNQLDPSTALRPVQGFPPVGFPDGNFDNRFLNINGRPYDFAAAYSQQWNFTIGRELRDYAIEVAYVGNKANKLMANRNINQPLPSAGSVNSRRFFPGWGSITFQEPRGNSIYHALQTKVEKRFSLGHLFLLSYTWAKAIDDSDSTQLSTTSGTGNLQDQFNLRAERSRSFQDVRHRLIFSYLWELPLGRGHAWFGDISPGWNRLVGGWQINGIASHQSGRAFTINSPFDQSNTGSSNIRPDATGVSPDLPSEERSVNRWINAAAFRIPDGFAFGNTSRNVGTGPSLTNFDVSIFKDIPIDSEGRRKLQFRAEFFNIMNTPQFQIPNRVFNTPQFGTITETVADNRDIQLALRFLW